MLLPLTRSSTPTSAVHCQQLSRRCSPWEIPPTQLKRVSFQVMACNLLYKITYWSSKWPNNVKIWRAYTFKFNKMSNQASSFPQGTAPSVPTAPLLWSEFYTGPQICCTGLQDFISPSGPGPIRPCLGSAALLATGMMEFHMGLHCSMLHAHWQAKSHIHISNHQLTAKLNDAVFLKHETFN